MAGKKGGLFEGIRKRVKREMEGIREIIWEIRERSKRRPSIGEYVLDRWRELREGIHD